MKDWRRLIVEGKADDDPLTDEEVEQINRELQEEWKLTRGMEEPCPLQ